MLVKQIELEEPDGAKHVCWVDAKYAVLNHILILKLGDGEHSPPGKVVQVWDATVDLSEIQEREVNRRAFGGSIK